MTQTCVWIGVRKSPSPPLTRKDTGLRHHPEDESGITARETADFPSFICEEGFLIHCSGHQMVLQRHARSMFCCFRDEDEGMRKADRHSHQGHHNSRAKRLMGTTINVAPEERGYLKCCAGELCFSRYKLEVRRSNPLRSLVGKM